MLGRRLGSLNGGSLGLIGVFVLRLRRLRGSRLLPIRLLVRFGLMLVPFGSSPGPCWPHLLTSGFILGKSCPVLSRTWVIFSQLGVLWRSKKMLLCFSCNAFSLRETIFRAKSSL